MHLDLEVANEDLLDELPEDGSAPSLEQLLKLLHGFEQDDWFTLSQSDDNSAPWFQVKREESTGFRVEFFDPATRMIYASTPTLVALPVAEAALRTFVLFGADSKPFRASTAWVKGEHQPKGA